MSLTDYYNYSGSSRHAAIDDGSLKLRTALQLFGHLGPRWLAYRVSYYLRQRMGVLRRLSPLVTWDELPLSGLTVSPEQAEPERIIHELRTNACFLFSAADHQRFRALLKGFDQGHAAQEWVENRIQELARGRVQLFSGEIGESGWPPRWHANPLTGESAPAVDHFSRIPEFGFGDVKVIWESSRFSFAFDLVRIYWRTGDERCAEMFWEAVEDWRRHNPPNAGINWKCGQEAAFRAFAWCFGMWGFLDSRASTPERVTMLATMLAVTAVRIEANIGYALSQQNNHGISEAAGLLTIGHTLPMLRGSDRWASKGRGLLEKQARELIYEDGGSSQYSANYHRVMLDDYVWAIRIAEGAGRPLSEQLVDRVCRAGRFLQAIQDRVTGGVPRYGHDDGARVLPLAHCDYDDYRPVLQAVAALDRDGPLPYGSGPWNEKLLWLFGPEALNRSSVTIESTDAWKESGYGLIRRNDSFAFVRGGRFRHRPSQADLLHVDIWWRGHNVAIDPGTYSYNGPGRWQSIPLATTACHNTVGVDGLDQMERVSRFLFLPWPTAPRYRQVRSPGGQIGLLELQHDGYERLADPVTHRRAVVQLGQEHWLIVDQLTASAQHEYRLQWLFADLPTTFDPEAGRLTLTFDDGSYAAQVLAEGGIDVSLMRADPEGARGWHAPRYQQIAPAPSLTAKARAGRFRFFSFFGPADWHATLDKDRLRIAGSKWNAEAHIAPIDATSPLTTIRWDGEQPDQLELG